MISVIAHRGYWIEACEKNTAVAFSRALNNGFGIETDFRDLNGELVVSHDVPMAGAMTAKMFCSLYKVCPVSSPMALNIKSDGLQVHMKSLIKDAGFDNYFAFDMAIPDMLGYLEEGVQTYMRLSEYEPKSSLIDRVQGVWLDAFTHQWYDFRLVDSLLAQGKHVSIVSPELHGKPHQQLWNWIGEHSLHKNALTSICTDFPLQAKEFFNVEN